MKNSRTSEIKSGTASPMIRAIPTRESRNRVSCPTHRFQKRDKRTVPLSHLQDDFSFQNGTEMFTVGAFTVFRGALLQLTVIDPTEAISDFLRGGDSHALVLFKHADEVRRAAQGIDCPGVDPGEATAEQLSLEPALLQVEFVK